MTLYRGPGGTGSATSDADTTLYQDFLNQTQAARDAALQAETNAELAEANAEAAEAGVAASAAAAASSASAAASSASSASTSATNAASSASSASTSASNASSSASSASSSASAASTSATNAASSATAAASSASAASTSATNAANSATSASNSASTATTQATNAASSATAAASSATAAQSAQTAAEAARDAALSAYDNFDDRYLGPKASDPTLDNDGNALITGALYFNTATNVMKVYDGSTWVAAYVSAAGVLLVANNLSDVANTATARANLNVPTRTGGDASGTWGINVTGNAATVTNGVYTTGDQTIAGTKTFSSNPILSAGTANGLAFLNASKVLTTGSALTFDGSQFYVNSNSTTASGFFQINDATTTQANSFGTIVRNANDGNGRYSLSAWRAQNASGLTQYSYIGTQSISGAANYTPEMVFGLSTGASSYAEQMRLTSTGLGIGTSSPGYRLDVNGIINGNNSIISRRASGSQPEFVLTQTGVASWSIYNPPSSTDLRFYNGTDLLTIASTGNVGIGTSSPGYRLDTLLGAGAGNIFRAGQSGVSNGYTITTSGSALTHIWANGGSDAMRLDSSGNLGLGVTPSAWGGSSKILQISNAAFRGAGNSAYVGANYYFDGSNNRYIASAAASLYEQDAGRHIFYTAPSGTAGNAISFTQAMTLDASGNLLVGTSSQAPLVGAGKYFTLYNNSNTTLSVQSVDGGNDRNATLELLSSGNGGSISQIVYGDTDTTPGTPSPLVFAGYHNGTRTERARIDSNGALLVGATSQPNPGFTSRIAAVQANANAIASMDATNASGGWGIIMRYTASAPNGTGNDAFSFQDSSATRFTVRSNGGIANFQANNVNLSDRREKTNFAPAGEYLSKICAIPVQTFNYIDQNMEDDPGTTLGVVAQDVQAVAPELVMESNWGTKDEPKMRLSIYQTDLQYALMKCIQEQQAIIEQLKADVAALKGA